MHHATIDRWSRGWSSLHLRDARAKLLLLLTLLIAISTLPSRVHPAVVFFGPLLIAGALFAQLPLGELLRKLALAVPFFATFSLILYASGEPARAIALFEKGVLCAFATLLFISVTMLRDLTRALDWFRVPKPLILTVQFLYRYLFVVSEQAQHMRIAAASRGGRTFGFSGAASALAVLFIRSWQRADGIYAAMLARGFHGSFPQAAPPRFRIADTIFLTLGIAATVTTRIFLAMPSLSSAGFAVWNPLR